ncbi:MAG TPA: hypothetical protein VKD22_17830, partial [Ramlibacter sp.]|nr:hypothetical protein [Ramlibacter sp.]
MYDKDGGTGIRLGGPPPKPPDPDADQPGPRPRGPNRMGAVASPDGRFIYFAQRTGLFSYNETFPVWQIHRFDRRNSEISTLTQAQGSAMRPLLSPDGKSMVYATRYETGTALKVRDLETGEERWLLDPVTRDDQESIATRDTMPGYAFMPDGKSLLMDLNGHIARIDFASGKATTIPFTAKVEADIAPRLHFEYRVDDSPMVKARLIRWPALSPDGKRVVFGALNHLWIMDLPDGKPRRLTKSDDGEFMPAWSRDGRWIAYVTWSAASGNIYRVSADGGEPQLLTKRSAYYSEPAFSPDGSKIVFITGRRDEQLYADLHMLENHSEEADYPDDAMLERAREREITGIEPDEGFDLRWIPAAGGDTVFIGPAQGGHHPHFGADPERVYLTTRRGLTSLRLDGLDRRVALKLTGSGPGPNPEGADDIVISPDGNKAFVNLDSKFFLVPVPEAGKETVRISI